MQFEAICKEHYAKIYNYILARTGKKEAAEDITQEVFLIAYRKGKGFLRHEKPLAFLYVTAKNLILEYMRQSARISLCDELEIQTLEPDVFEQICEKKAENFDEQFYQRQVLQQLTNEEKMFYKEYYVNNKTMKSIAEELKMNETAVRMKYVRLRKKVKGIVAGLQLDEF